MIDGDLLAVLRAEIRRQVQIILSGAAANNASVVSEDIREMIPGLPTIPNRPVMHPYGLASRAPEGTLQVTGRMGDHPGNRMVLGHRDANRPKNLDEGETSVYSVGGYQVQVKKTSVTIGKGGAVETMVVGETLATFLGALLDEIVIHTHASPGAPPSDAAAFTSLKSQYVTNGKILAKDGGRF